MFSDRMIVIAYTIMLSLIACTGNDCVLKETALNASCSSLMVPDTSRKPQVRILAVQTNH
jgi:hypothetical protein